MMLEVAYLKLVVVVGLSLQNSKFFKILGVKSKF